MISKPTQRQLADMRKGAHFDVDRLLDMLPAIIEAANDLPASSDGSRQELLMRNIIRLFEAGPLLCAEAIGLVGPPICQGCRQPIASDERVHRWYGQITHRSDRCKMRLRRRTATNADTT